MDEMMLRGNLSFVETAEPPVDFAESDWLEVRAWFRRNVEEILEAILDPGQPVEISLRRLTYSKKLASSDARPELLDRQITYRWPGKTFEEAKRFSVFGYSLLPGIPSGCLQFSSHGPRNSRSDLPCRKLTMFHN